MIENKILFTNEQLNNLKIFLGRVDLKGFEVPAFIEIMQVIEKGVVEQDGEQVC